WVLSLLVPGLLAGAVIASRRRFWAGLGIGLLALLITPIIAVLLFIGFVGYYAGLVLILVYFVSLLVAWLLAAIILGAWLWRLITRSNEFLIDWKSVLLGVVAFKLLMLIPIIGWIACFILFLTALGALILAVWQRNRAQETVILEAPPDQT